MNTQIGLWIDHRKAVIVFLTGKDERVEIVESRVEKHIHPSGGPQSKTQYSPQEVKAEDIRDRKYENHLGRYYDEVISRIRGAESILIFGPDAAKDELQKHIMGKELRGRIVHLETADKMTERQIVAKAHQYFTNASKIRGNILRATKTIEVKI